jgi:hypothetical protein
MAMFFINQTAPLDNYAGVQNTQIVNAPVSSSLTQNTPAAAASTTAVQSTMPTFWGIDLGTWIAIISLGVYIYFSLKGERN